MRLKISIQFHFPYNLSKALITLVGKRNFFHGINTIVKTMSCLFNNTKTYVAKYKLVKGFYKKKCHTSSRYFFNFFKLIAVTIKLPNIFWDVLLA